MRTGRTSSIIIAVVALTTFVPLVQAHELSVSQPGTVELDLGTADPARLMHATLVAPGDTLTTRVQPTGSPLEVLLLVPDEQPERAVADDELPSLQVRGAGRSAVVRAVDRSRVTDEATGIHYRVIATSMIVSDGSRGARPATIVVRRGDAPTRVALRVGSADVFQTADPERTPRTVARARAWLETPAVGSVPAPRTPPGTTADVSRAVWGGALAMSAVILAIWWVRIGRRRSRVRGVERQRDEP